MLFIILYVLKYKFYNFEEPFYYRKNLLIHIILVILTISYTFISINNAIISYCKNDKIPPLSTTITFLFPFLITILTYFIFIITKDGVLIKPISNTFGYLFSFLINLSDKFKDLLTDSDKIDNGKLKKLFKIVYNDPNICINEFTPYNIINKFIEFEDIINSDIMDQIRPNDEKKSQKPISNDLIQFINGVKMKFLFSELLFLLLLQMINNLWTKNEILKMSCSSSASTAKNTIMNLYNTNTKPKTKKTVVVSQ